VNVGFIIDGNMFKLKTWSPFWAWRRTQFDMNKKLKQFCLAVYFRRMFENLFLVK